MTACKKRLLSDPVIMTENKIAFIIAKMHSVALAIAEPFAVSALVLLHPGTVTVWLETVFPYIDEIILVNITLMIVSTYAAAG